MTTRARLQRVPGLRPLVRGVRSVVHHARNQAQGRLAVRLRNAVQAAHTESLAVTEAPILVLAPHYDDETLGCGGLIALKRARGVPVTVAFVTDGRGCFGPNPPDPEALEAMRRKEASRALTHLGVSAEAIRFLNLPDGRLEALLPEARAQAVDAITTLLAECQPGEVYAPHRHDRHKDHEVTNALVRDALARNRSATGHSPILWEYAVWFFWAAPREAATQLDEDMAGARWLTIDTALEKKRAAIAEYASQHGVLPTGFLADHARPQELYVPAPPL